MVLKLLAILPSGSAGKFLKKIWNLEKWGGGTTTPSVRRNKIKTAMKYASRFLLL
uniref:Uncharacterized protein n=1 Tax=Lactococcus garvieae TaxID=1363 RepID=H2B2R2_9LACT|nr:hypothetical protein [Lactococcus garvieae]CCF71021.1 hypothetical protein [Lactococcus garvieae]